MMTIWKWFSLIASGLILLGGVITIFQFSKLIWQKKTPENLTRFRRLAIRFAVLTVLALALMIAGYLVRTAYYSGAL